MIHMPQQRFLQQLDDLIETARANLQASYRRGSPDWDVILDSLSLARSWWGTPTRAEHYGKPVPTPPIPPAKNNSPRP